MMDTRFIWIRHASTEASGRLVGRTDIPAQPPSPPVLRALRAQLAEADTLLTSPLTRARQTAAVLFPEREATQAPELMEQDFGEWEGRPYADAGFPPDANAAELADCRPPGGESFTDVCQRVGAVCERLVAEGEGRRLILIAHAGVIRAALVHALGAAPASGLEFTIDPLSLTGIRLFGGGGVAVDFVNRAPI